MNAVPPPSRAGRAGLSGAAARRLFLRFMLADEVYVLDARDIVKVLPLRPLKQVPATPAWVAGLYARGGDIIPVIDLRQLALGVPSAAHASTRLVLVHYRCDGDAVVRPLGIILEHAMETVYLDPAGFRHDGLDHHDARYLGPVLQTPQGMVQWVCVADLLPADVHARLFPDTRGEPA